MKEHALNGTRRSACAIRREDYELYHIQMPFLLRRDRRRAYLYRELEKEHPCFSDRCACDTTYRLKQGKLVAHVAVVDSLRLAQYHLQFPGRKLVLEEERKRIVFMEGKQKLFVPLSAVIVFVATLLFIYMSTRYVLGYQMFGKKNMGTKSKITSNQKDVGISNQQSDYEQSLAQTHTVQPEAICSELLQSIKKNDGTLSRFIYKRNSTETSGYTYEIQAAVSGCYPEQLSYVQSDAEEKIPVTITVSPITYENKIPFFSTNVSCDTGLYEYGTVTENSIARSVNLPALRNVILYSNATIDYEDSAAKQITFTATPDQFVLAAEALASFAKTNSLSFDEVSFSFEKRVDSGASVSKVKCTISISSAEEAHGSTILSLLARYGIKRQQRKEQTVKKALPTRSVAKINGEKIGQIVTADGRRVTYYRDANGKIKEVSE